MPKFFRKWSQAGIADEDLMYLPVNFCSVSSSTLVRCQFPANIGFQKLFNKVACTVDECFSYLDRIPPVVNARNSQPITPQLPFSSPITVSSNP